MVPTLGKRIKEIRLNLGKNMNDFGELVGGANRSLVSKWENDKSVPGIERLHTIASLGGITYEVLMSEVNTNSVLEKSNNLNIQLELSIKMLEKLKEKLDVLEQNSNDQNESSETTIHLSDEISKLNDQIYQEILKIVNLRYNLSEINNYLKELKVNEDIYKLQEEHNKTFKLEDILSLEINLTINNRTLSSEEKDRALQILKLVFTN